MHEHGDKHVNYKSTVFIHVCIIDNKCHNGVYSRCLGNHSICESVTLLQKRAMRAVCYTKYNAHTEPLFKMCNVLKFNDLYETKLS